MADRPEQTLTAVQSPLSPGEAKDRAVLLVAGSAEAPGLPARARLQIVGDELFLGRRADGVPVHANAAVLDDGLVSGQHARITRGAGGFDLEDLGSKNGTFLRGEPVRKRVTVADGDEIRIGTAVLTLRRFAGVSTQTARSE